MVTGFSQHTYTSYLHYFNPVLIKAAQQQHSFTSSYSDGSPDRGGNEAQRRRPHVWGGGDNFEVILVRVCEQVF